MQLMSSGDGRQIVDMEEGRSGIVQKATVTIDHDQIKALPTSAVEVVPAPGAGKFLLYLGGTFFKGSPFSAPFDEWGWGIPGDDPERPPSVYLNVNDDGTGWAGIFYGSSALDVPASVAIADGDDDSVYSNCFSGNGGDQLCNLAPETYVSSSGIGFGAYAPDLRPQWNKALFFAVRNPLGDFTDGHPDNTLTVVVFYAEIDLT
jgi:hypothetical protein